MKNRITFVGLDVHKNSIDVALADSGRDGRSEVMARSAAISIRFTKSFVSYKVPALHCVSSMKPVPVVTKYIAL